MSDLDRLVAQLREIVDAIAVAQQEARRQPSKSARPERAAGWMNTRSAADYLGVTEGYLRNQRSAGSGPPYGKTTVGNGAVRYRQADLDAWLTGRGR